MIVSVEQDMVYVCWCSSCLCGKGGESEGVGEREGGRGKEGERGGERVRE